MECTSQPLVASLLKESADVMGPDKNCQYSEYTLVAPDTPLENLSMVAEAAEKYIS